MRIFASARPVNAVSIWKRWNGVSRLRMSLRRSVATRDYIYGCRPWLAESIWLPSIQRAEGRMVTMPQFRSSTWRQELNVLSYNNGLARWSFLVWQRRLAANMEVH